MTEKRQMIGPLQIVGSGSALANIGMVQKQLQDLGYYGGKQFPVCGQRALIPLPAPQLPKPVAAATSAPAVDASADTTTEPLALPLHDVPASFYSQDIGSQLAALASTPQHADSQGNRPEYIEAHVATTDGGGEVAAARRLRHIWNYNDLYRWDLDNDCFLHHYHLGAASILKFVNWVLLTLMGFDLSYWSALAQVFYTWREVADSLFEFWCSGLNDHHGAMMFASTVPPAPLVGRWGHASKREKHGLKAPRAKLAIAFRSVVQR